MAYPTLGGLQLVAVESIVVTKESNLIPITFFGQDSDAAELFDMFGATRTVNIVGTWAGEKAALRTVVVPGVTAEIVQTPTPILRTVITVPIGNATDALVGIWKAIAVALFIISRT